MNYLYIKNTLPVLPKNRHSQRDINAKEYKINTPNIHIK